MLREYETKSFSAIRVLPAVLKKKVILGEKKGVKRKFKAIN